MARVEDAEQIAFWVGEHLPWLVAGLADRSAASAQRQCSSHSRVVVVGPKIEMDPLARRRLLAGRLDQQRRSGACGIIKTALLPDPWAGSERVK
jgi:hypothetical protein